MSLPNLHTVESMDGTSAAQSSEAKSSFDLAALLSQREPERYKLHSQHMNDMMVRVLQTIGFNVGFKSGQGQYLYDRDNVRYLDLLSGWGVFGLGRNHPTVSAALKVVLDADLPNLVQMDLSVLAGVLAEKLIAHVPYMQKVFFANSGAETVEAGLKFAKRATGRNGIVYCDHAFHGLSIGALSLNGEVKFREGFGTLLSDCQEIAFNDLAALEKALSTRQVAAFIVEPIQGKTVAIPDDNYLRDALALCRKYGTIFIADEIQSGLGRSGKFLACEHWNVEPDMVLLSKALSGGYVPVGAVLTTKAIFDKTFDRMDNAVVHGSTFGKNDLAMAAGIATLEVMEQEKLVENSAQKGARLLAAFNAMLPRYELLKKVRGKGLMIGLEFGQPKSLALKASWALIEKANAGLFSQLIIVPLFKDEKILVQVAGHGSHVIKLLPALTINDADCDWIEKSFDKVIADSHKVPGAVWSLGKTLAENAIKMRAGK